MAATLVVLMAARNAAAHEPPAQAVEAVASTADTRGYTRWRISWRFRTEPTADGRCRLRALEQDLDTQVELSPNADEPLRRHEMGHVAIAQSAARLIGDRLAQLAPALDCTALYALVDRMTRAVIADHHERERRFDQFAARPATPARP